MACLRTSLRSSSIASGGLLLAACPSDPSITVDTDRHLGVGFSHDSQDGCSSFERGWFIGDLDAFSISCNDDPLP